MGKYKVRYYENFEVIEKEIEAYRFAIKENKNGMSVTFYEPSPPGAITFAFSTFVSIEKID